MLDGLTDPHREERRGFMSVSFGSRLAAAVEISATDPLSAIKVADEIRAEALELGDEATAFVATQFLVMLYDMTGDKGPARLDAARLVVQNPRADGWSWIALGTAAEAANEPEEARAAFQRAFDMSQSDDDLREVATRCIARVNER
jgi:hypothetical protein